MERVVVVPRNGYANRLQAWASSDILATTLGVPAFVIWESQEVATASAESLFDAELVHQTFMTADEFMALVGVSHGNMPRYLSYHDSGVIVLAGHDRGEQIFMHPLARMLAKHPEAHTLLIIAGGKFHIPGSAEPQEARCRFYNSLTWSSPIQTAVKVALDSRGTFDGLHIRETDRSISAPTTRQIERALSRIERDGDSSLLVVADTQDARAAWIERTRAMGFDSWAGPSTNFERASAAGGVDALVDWILLGRSSRIVFSVESSFGAEASVASGQWSASFPLSAGPVTRAGRAVRARLGSGKLWGWPQA